MSWDSMISYINKQLENTWKEIPSMLLCCRMEAWNDVSLVSALNSLKLKSKGVKIHLEWVMLSLSIQYEVFSYSR